MINADIEMKKAKTKIISKHSGWATIVIPLNLVKTDEVEVMATNGKSIFYNPTAIEKWFEENGRRKGQDFIHFIAQPAIRHCRQLPPIQ